MAGHSIRDNMVLSAPQQIFRHFGVQEAIYRPVLGRPKPGNTWNFPKRIRTPTFWWVFPL